MAKSKSNRKWFWIIGIIILLGVALAAFFGNKSGDEGIKVELSDLEYRDILETVTASGKIYPEKEVKISSDVSGEIVKLMVVEGDTVKAGQVLARIDPDTYVSAVERGKATLDNAKSQVSMAESQIANAKAQKDQIMAQLINARTVHNRNQQLLTDGVISQVEFDQSESSLRSLEANLKAADAGVLSAQKSAEGASYNVKSTEATLRELNTSLSRTTIKAPVSGVVSSLSVEQGERVVGTIQMTGTELMRIANLSSMQVDVDVSENDILRVSVGDSVAIEVDAYPDKAFSGVVTHVSNSASNLSQLGSISTDEVTNFLVEVRIDSESYAELMLPGRPHPFRPGMSATVDIFTNAAREVLSVPVQAVTTRVPEEEKDKVRKTFKEVVFAMQGDSAVMYEVKTGIQNDEYIQITSELPDTVKLISGPYAAVSEELEQGEKVTEKKEEDEKKKKRGR